MSTSQLIDKRHGNASFLYACIDLCEIFSFSLTWVLKREFELTFRYYDNTFAGHK